MSCLKIIICIITLLMITACGSKSYQKSTNHYDINESRVPTGNLSQDQDEYKSNHQKWLINGSLRLHVTSLQKFQNQLIAYLNKKNTTSQNKVINEIVSKVYHQRSYQNTLKIKLRVNPSDVDSLLSWIHTKGKVRDEKITRSEVSKKLQNYTMKVKNKKLTLERLRTLLQQVGHKVTDILAIEKEMTRVREQIERDQGHLKWLSDQVARARIDLTIIEYKKSMAEPTRKQAKFYLVGRPSVLFQNQQQQLGTGLSLVNPSKAAHFRLDLDYFSPQDMQPMSFFVTIGGGTYSDFLGAGRRTYLNPYLSLRTGYAYQEQHAFVLGVEAGIELFKNRYFFINAKGQALSLFNEDTQFVTLTGIDLGIVY